MDTLVESGWNKRNYDEILNEGINFCGYLIYKNRLRLRAKGKLKLKRKLKLIEKLIKSRKINIVEAKRYLSGHIGYICHGDVDNLVKKIF